MHKQFKIVDLFAGAGGFSLGFTFQGQNILAAVEKDKWASETYKFNHPNTKLIEDDIRNISNTEICEIIGSKGCDIIIGGPPCQGFSLAGPPKDPKDPRNSLFVDFANWVEILQPNIFIMENVKGLLSRRNHEGKKVIDIIINTFRNIGYFPVVWKLNAVNYGVPQFRERIFIIGTKTPNILEEPKYTNFPNLIANELGKKSYISVGEAILDLPKLNAGEGNDEILYSGCPFTEYQKWAHDSDSLIFNHQAMKHTKRIIKRFEQISEGGSIADVESEFCVNKRNGNGEKSTSVYHMNNRRLSITRPSFTVPASFYSTFIHPIENRNITAREAARLQSFPDSYRFFGKRTVISSKLLHKTNKTDDDHLSQYNQIGNAVPPLLAKAIAGQVLSYLDSISTGKNDEVKNTKDYK